MKKTIVIIFTLIVLLTISILLIKGLQGESEDVLVRVVVWQDTSPYTRNPLVNYFSITRDGVFTSYLGTSQRHRDISRGNFMIHIQEREVVILEEYELNKIHELIDMMVYLKENPEVWGGMVITHMNVTLYHDGRIFEGTRRSRYFDELFEMLVERSPLSISRW